MFEQNTRTADLSIYKNSKEKPKEVHKKVINILNDFILSHGDLKCADIGCASGNFARLLKESFSDVNFDIYGVDVSEALLEDFKIALPEAKAIKQSISTPLSGEYNLITCLGVMSIFDDFEDIFLNMFDALTNGGVLVIKTLFNDFPVDVITRYRDNTKFDHWEPGWNVFSKKRVSDLLESRNIDFTFVDFLMPFQIEQNKDDCMRTWTVRHKDNPFQLVNGAGLLVNQSILKVVKK